MTSAQTEYCKEPPLTCEQAMALDFEAWEGDPQEQMPDAGKGAMESNRLTIVMAIVLMHKSKAELMEWIRSNDEVAVDILDRIQVAQTSLKSALEILDGCFARLVCAGSTIEVEDEKN